MIRKAQEPFWTSYLDLVNTRHRLRISRTVSTIQQGIKTPQEQEGVCFSHQDKVTLRICMFSWGACGSGRRPPGTMLHWMLHSVALLFSDMFRYHCHERKVKYPCLPLLASFHQAHHTPMLGPAEFFPKWLASCPYISPVDSHILPSSSHFESSVLFPCLLLWYAYFFFTLVRFLRYCNCW